MKKCIPDIAINELHRVKPGVDKARSPERRTAEIDERRGDRVEITRIRRRIDEGAAVQATSRKYGQGQTTAVKKAVLEYREVGEYALKGSVAEIAVFQGSPGETYPPELLLLKIQTGVVTISAVEILDNRSRKSFQVFLIPLLSEQSTLL